MHSSRRLDRLLGRWGRRAAAAVVTSAAVLLATPATTAGATGGTGGTGSVPGTSSVARWVPPLAGRLHVTRAFLPPATRYGRGHRGVDLAAAPGSPVRSAANGVVTFAGMLAGRGVLVVRTGAWRTTYEPLAPAVHVRSVVRLGQLIGFLQAGHPGCPATACLHWGLLEGDEYRDPLSLLRPSVVRLLPLDGHQQVGATTDRSVAGHVGGGAVGGAVAGGVVRVSAVASSPPRSAGGQGNAGAVTGAVLAGGAAAATGAALRRRTVTKPAARAP